LVYNSFIKNIPLPDENVTINIMAVATGWGKLYVNAPMSSNELRKISMLIISTAACQSHFNRVIDPTHLCVQNEEGIGTCHVSFYNLYSHYLHYYFYLQ
jgi:hypothetical protein